MNSLPIPVPDLCCAITGANISSQHLEGGSFPCSIHSQQTKALYANTHCLVMLKHLSTLKYYNTIMGFLNDYIDVKTITQI